MKSEKICVHVHAGFWMHRIEYLGRRVDVSAPDLERHALFMFESDMSKVVRSRISEVRKQHVKIFGLLRRISGGPSGLVYGFLITWIGTLSIFITLSELASM
jgi:hypothetical protein